MVVLSRDALAPVAIVPTSGHTWGAVDLIAADARTPEPPSIAGLFYPGRRHVVSGEAEAGKSMLLLAASVDEIRAGHGVVWVDTDSMGAGPTLERLRHLGLDDEQIARLFAYLEPAEPLSALATEHVCGLIRDRDCRLVVYDAFNSALTLHGYDPASTPDVEAFYRRACDPFCRLGAAVVLPDHVVKVKEARGKYAYGSERKHSGADVHLGMTAIDAFARGRVGKAKLTVHKDRPGFLERPSPGLFVLSSDPESGRCAWRLEPDHSITTEGEFRPTGLMEKVSRHLEHAGEPCSHNQIQLALKGKTDYKRLAIAALVQEGFATEFHGENRTRFVKLERPFREADEWA